MRGRACSLAWMEKHRDFLLSDIPLSEKAEYFCFGEDEVVKLITAIRTKENLQEKVKKQDLSIVFSDEAETISEDDLEYDKIPPTHYREIASAPENQQLEIAKRVSDGGLTVKQTQVLVKESKGKGNEILFEYPEEVFNFNVWEAEDQRDPRYGDGGFHGNCSGQVVKQCLWRYLYPYIDDVKKALVIDPMAGSGTVKDVCNELEIPCRAFDIYPKYKSIEYGDARKLELSDSSVDLIFIHFPYWNMVKYNQVFKKEADPADISLMKYTEFCESSKQIFQESKRILKKNRFLTILIGDMRKHREIIDLSAEFSFIGRQAGFKLFDKIIKIVTAQRSRTPLSNWRAKKYNFHQLTCDTLLVFLKEA